MDASLDISVVVPCRNAAEVLRGTAESLVEYLSGLGRTWELVLVDDGSKDETGAAISALSLRSDCHVVGLRHAVNQGKGRAVRDGMLAAKGRFRIFIDADLDYPPNQIDRVLERLDAGVDVVVASRVAAGATMTLSPWHIQYMYTRHLMSRVLNKVFRNFFVRGITDSQAGLKGFTGRAAELIFSRTTVDRFSFDIEVLYIARLLGLSIEQVPVHFVYGRQASTVAFARAGIELIRDMVRVKLSAAMDRYNLPREQRLQPKRKLVLTLDDYGLSPWANRGISRAVRAGAATSVSVMASPHLDRWLGSRSSETGFGLHVNLTEGRPISGPDGLEPILKADGSFAGLMPLVMACMAGRLMTRRLEREIVAQAQRVTRAGFRLGHIDGHEHVQHLPAVRQAVAAAAIRLGVRWVRVADESLGFMPTSWLSTIRKLALVPHVAATRALFSAKGLNCPSRFFGIALVRSCDLAGAIHGAIAQCRGRVNEISLHVAETGGEHSDRLGRWRSGNLDALLGCNLPEAARRASLKLTSFAAAERTEVPLRSNQ